MVLLTEDMAGLCAFSFVLKGVSFYHVRKLVGMQDVAWF